LAYCAKNGITGAEFVSAMRMPTLDEQGVAESYWAKLQNERNTKLNTLVNELKESIEK
jgi:malate/lactate dehydrogenase